MSVDRSRAAHRRGCRAGGAGRDRHRGWGYVGAVPLLTGLLGWCGLYTLLGLNTCPMKNESGAG